MDIDWRLLSPETLRAVVEEYVSREGTDYGAVELAFETKVGQVYRMLEQEKAKLVFDPETETCDLREVDSSVRRAAPVVEGDDPSCPSAVIE